MAKKVEGLIKLQIPAGGATPAPPVGPALGQKGVNIMDFCKQFNAKTADQPGMIIPVVITVYSDRSFTFITKTPPAAVLLKKAAGLDIQTICALHGPILKENLGYYLDLYNTWSSYGVESEGVVIAYTSVYGNTKKAVELLADKLTALGCPKVTVTDLARDDMAEAVEDAFRYGKLVLATTTYNGDIFPFMKTFIEHLTERGYRNRTIGLIENGSWAPTAAKTMLKMFEGSKNLTFTDTTVTIKSAVNTENEAQIAALAEELCK